MMGEDGALRAGAAEVDITPAQGAMLAGNVARREPAESVLDPLHAKALVLERAGRKLCILALDVTIIERPYTERIRAAVAERCGIERDAIMVHATQTHSAPAIGGFLLDDEFPLPEEFDFLRLRDAEFSEMATQCAIEAVVRANESLRPARIGWNSARLDGIAFNRRGVTRNGRVGMPWTYSTLDRPLGQTDYRYVEGPTDPEVAVAWLQDDRMRTIAFLLHHTCHPVNVFYWRGRGHHGEVSADWPGAWATELAAVYGGDAVGLVMNGCCGNINPWPVFTPDFVPDHRRMGRALAAISCEALARTAFHGHAALDWRRRDIPLAIREPDPSALAAAKARIAAHPLPEITDRGLVDMSWYYAAMLVSLDMLRRRTPEEPYEVQAFRIGDMALVGLPGEPFVEGQLKIKIESPAYPTFVAHATSHYAGYIPTREAFSRGGHEVDTSWWSRHEPGALDAIVETAIGMLTEMFPA